MEFVVAEDTFDVVPDGERRGMRLVDDVEDVFGDGVVEPINHAVVDIDHAPLGVAVVFQGRWRVDVVGETELAEDGVEGAAPLAVVGLVDVEDRDVRADVDGLEQGGRSWNSSSVGEKAMVMQGAEKKEMLKFRIGG